MQNDQPYDFAFKYIIVGDVGTPFLFKNS